MPQSQSWGAGECWVKSRVVQRAAIGAGRVPGGRGGAAGRGARVHGAAAARAARARRTWRARLRRRAAATTATHAARSLYHLSLLTVT
jgi:hypothetical protein